MELRISEWKATMCEVLPSVVPVIPVRDKGTWFLVADVPTRM